MRLAATVIIYNPPKNFIDNIYTYIDDIEKLYIFDNSSDKSFEIPNEILNKSEYFHSGNNEGIAKRLNEAIEKSQNDGFDYLLTMDQDSSFKKGDLEKYKELIKAEKNSSLISMYGVRYAEMNNPMHETLIFNQTLITSGSIINLTIALKIQGFDENLFIDGVDTEFCIKSFKYGYKTILYNNISLTHVLGESKSVITPTLKKSIRKYHTPSRVYYIIRNHFYLRKKYPQFHDYIKINHIINELKNGILYGKSIKKYLLFSILAIVHFKRNRLGKFEV